MTKENFNKAVVIEKLERGNSLVFTASIQFHSCLFTDKDALLTSSLIESNIIKNLTEQLWRHVYEDRRHEFREAVYELATCNVYDFEARSKAEEKLIKAAAGL